MGYKKETEMIVDNKRGLDYSTANQPLYYSTAFLRPDLNAEDGYLYVRHGNPNRDKLEEKLAKLENGRYAYAFNSGMSAISAALMTFSPGDHIIMPADMYGGTYQLVKTILKRFGLNFTEVDQTNINNVTDAVNANTKAIYIETPSNPTLKVTNIKAITQFASANNIKTLVDNTFMTPLGQNPLNLGADIVIHSATKFLSGHSELIAGAIIVNDDDISTLLKELQVVMGLALGTYDCWTLNQHLKTLGIRWKQSTSNTEKIHRFLTAHQKIEKVYYPLDNSVHMSQANHAGAVISFKLKNEDQAQKFADHLKIPLISVSLGGVETILSHPKTSSHKDLSESEQREKEITDGLFRLSVGIENSDDLITDLQAALETI